METVQRSGAALGVGREGVSGQSAGSALSGDIMVDACPYTFVQTHRMYNATSDPDANWELWMVRKWWCGCRTLAGVRITGEVLQMWGQKVQRVYGHSCSLLLDSALNLKLP